MASCGSIGQEALHIGMDPEMYESGEVGKDAGGRAPDILLYFLYPSSRCANEKKGINELSPSISTLNIA